MDVADITEEEKDEEVGHRGGDCIVKSENELRTAEEMMNGKERQIRRNCGRGGEGPQRDLGRTTLGHGRNGKELDGGSRDADKAVREKRKGKE